MEIYRLMADQEEMRYIGDGLLFITLPINS